MRLFWARKTKKYDSVYVKVTVPVQVAVPVFQFLIVRFFRDDQQSSRKNLSH
jgi:hypothetical protein